MAFVYKFPVLQEPLRKQSKNLVKFEININSLSCNIGRVVMHKCIQTIILDTEGFVVKLAPQTKKFFLIFKKWIIYFYLWLINGHCSQNQMDFLFHIFISINLSTWILPHSEFWICPFLQKTKISYEQGTLFWIVVP